MLPVFVVVSALVQDAQSVAAVVRVVSGKGEQDVSLLASARDAEGVLVLAAWANRAIVGAVMDIVLVGLARVRVGAVADKAVVGTVVDVGLIVVVYFPVRVKNCVHIEHKNSLFRGSTLHKKDNA